MADRKRGVWALGIGLTLGCSAAFAIPLRAPVTIAAGQQDSRETADQPDRRAPIDDVVIDDLTQLKSAHPGVAVSYGEDGRIARLYGRPFGEGATPVAAGQAFVDRYAGVWNLQPADLSPTGPFPSGQHTTPMMYDEETNSYRFTGVHYTQQRDGVPVFRGRLTLLARHDADNALVLASADIRPIGDFAPADVDGPIDVTILKARVLERFHTECEITDVQHVIWAGVDDVFAEPTLGIHYVAEYFGRAGHVKWLIIDDARTGEELYRENQILHANVEGTVSAMSTLQTGASVCSDAVEMPLPYARVLHGTDEVFADEFGNYVFPGLPDGGDPVTLASGINGRYFSVQNNAGDNTEQSFDVNPPDTLNFVHDPSSAATPEHALAEVDSYIHSNLVRDFALSVNPDYPVIDNQVDFTINVNIAATCNATYSGNAINFYASGGGCNNTSIDSVIYHEYGHHLVNTGGSGQGQYGEGMSDCVALLITDDPILGRGFSSCGNGIRNADNSMQYPCFGGVHFCGTLLSGCVWSLREQLVSTEPDDWHDILSDLTINSILLHTGSMVTPQITLDFLTLDDDNANIFDGTPHYNEIMTAFLEEHSMDPDLDALTFSFPDGIPDTVHPLTGATLTIEVLPNGANPVPGTGVMFVDDGTRFTSMPMTEITPNVYEAALPAVACAQDAFVYFAAESDLPYTQQFPHEGAADPIRIQGATSIVSNFNDDFESDIGWSVVDDEFLTDGSWERGLPLGGGNRADPPTDADGSGQCYLTNRSGGNTDVDGGATVLTSPTLDATGSNVIAYWLWYSNASGAGPETDVFLTEVSDDNGVSWQVLDEIGPSGPEVLGGWNYKEYRLGDVPGFIVNDQFRIRFTASDTDPQSLVEAAVDGVELLNIQCGPTQPGDFDADGTVGLSDLLAILSNWGSCSPSAPCVNDSDGDGQVGLEELLEVLSNWGL